MPRRTKFSTDDVVQAAFDLVRSKGLAGLSAPAVAQQLGSSTMPIYSHFKSMQALEDAVVKRAWDLMDRYQTQSFTCDLWVDQAIGYIRFARDEPHLFKSILDGRNQELKLEMNRKHWDALGKSLKGYPAFQELDEEKIARIRYTRAMISNGIATAAKIGLNKLFIENDKLLARFITDASQALLNGYQQVAPLSGEERRLMEVRLKQIREG